MYLTIFFLLILIVKIRLSWDILRLVPLLGCTLITPLPPFSFPSCCVLAWVNRLLISWQIQSTVSTLRNTRGLPWPKGHKKKIDEDILDWLQAMFGFQVTSILFCVIASLLSGTYVLHIIVQKDNVANQREHLILLLANVHLRQFPKPDQQPKVYFFYAQIIVDIFWTSVVSC